MMHREQNERSKVQEDAFEKLHRQIDVLRANASKIPDEHDKLNYLEQVGKFQAYVQAKFSNPDFQRDLSKEIADLNASITALYQTLTAKAPVLQELLQAKQLAGTSLMALEKGTYQLREEAKTKHDDGAVRKATEILQQMEADRLQLIRALDDDTIKNIIGPITRSYQELQTRMHGSSHEEHPIRKTSTPSITTQSIFQRPTLSKELKEALSDLYEPAKNNSGPLKK